MLLQSNVDVAALDKNGRNLLHHVFISPYDIVGIFNFPRDCKKPSRTSSFDPIKLVSTLCNFPKAIGTIAIVDKEDETLLYYASAVGAFVSCLLLLKHNTDLLVNDVDCTYPLALAILCKHVILSIMLIKSSSATALGNLETDHHIVDIKRVKDNKTKEIR